MVFRVSYRGKSRLFILSCSSLISVCPKPFCDLCAWHWWMCVYIFIVFLNVYCSGSTGAHQSSQLSKFERQSQIVEVSKSLQILKCIEHPETFWSFGLLLFANKQKVTWLLNLQNWSNKYLMPSMAELHILMLNDIVKLYTALGIMKSSLRWREWLSVEIMLRLETFTVLSYIHN